MSQNNGFYERLGKEADRLQNVEIAHFQKKLDSIRRNKDEINNKLKNFAQLYL